VLAIAVAVGCEVLDIETHVPCVVDVNLEPTVTGVVVEVELCHKRSPLLKTKIRINRVAPRRR
jgi:hypothetical protein